MNKSFYVMHEAWYADITRTAGVYKQEILITVTSDDGPDYTEFGIRWILLPEPIPRLEVFDESWPGLIAHCQDLLRWLAQHSKPRVTPDQVVEFLKSVGYFDGTPRVRPPEYAEEELEVVELRLPKPQARSMREALARKHANMA